MLISRLLKSGGLPTHLMDDLRRAEVVEVSNVAEYFYEGNDREDWDLAVDFPCLAPVFPVMWMEWRIPRHSVSQKLGRVDLLTELTGEWAMGGALMNATHYDPESGWRVYAAIAAWTESMEYPVITDYDLGLMVDLHGRVISASTPLGSIFSEGAVNGAAQLFVPALAISLMHCHNVERVERGGKRAGKSRPRKGWGVRHYTLVIDPMKAVLRGEGQSEATGLKRALHICRGHFRDYREGKGLFGKHKALVWTPMHARGSAEVGVVTKDYKIKKGFDFGEKDNP